MADKSFGVKELNLLNASGTPTITSPNNLNLNANNVAISTNVTVGQNITISANAGIASLNVTGVSTFAGITTVTGNTLFTKQLSVSGVSTFQNASSYSFSVGAGNLVVNGNSIYGSSKIIISGGGGGDTYFYSGGTAYSDHIFYTLQGGLSLERFRINSSGAIKVGASYGTAGQVLTSNGSGSPSTWTTATGISTSAWTISNNSSSNYVISGPGGLSNANNPDLYLIRGQTYQFIMNAAGHGFGIQTSSGTWNNSNAYTTGITNAGAATGTITFQVPYSAPERLYYACTSQHSGMVGNIYIQGGSTDLKMADQWRITAVHAVPTQNSIISNNWERVDGTAQGTYIPNGGMTQSSGVFTFPYTGIYLVRFQGYFEENTSTNQAQVEMRASNDGGNSYSSIAFSPCSISNLGTYTYGNIQMETLIDVTNVSNVKIYWQTYSATATALDGSSTQNRTYATFLRIGDT